MICKCEVCLMFPKEACLVGLQFDYNLLSDYAYSAFSVIPHLIFFFLFFSEVPRLL